MINPVALRTVVTGLVGVLVGLGLIPEGVEETVIENALIVIASVLIAWSWTAGRRWRKESAPPPPAPSDGDP